MTLSLKWKKYSGLWLILNKKNKKRLESYNLITNLSNAYINTQAISHILEKLFQFGVTFSREKNHS